MSRYAAIADLQKRLSDLYGNLYRRLDGTDMTDEAQSDLDAAAAEIDGMIGTRYEIPVTAPEAARLLASWNLTLAEELAWSRSGKAETPENVRERVTHVRSCLAKVADGTMLLPGAAQSGEAGGGSVVAVEGNSPVFGRNEMKGY